MARRVLGLFGWRVEGGLPDESRFVLIVAPHTSNWDFPICILAMFTVGLRLSWLGKHTLFVFPVRPVLRWLGGEPIDRGSTHGTVETALARFRERDSWVLGVSPEGTRRRNPRWKSGFYRIAAGAGVGILPVTLDYSRRVLTLHPLFRPSGSYPADLPLIAAHFRPEMARRPEQFALPEPEDDTRLDAGRPG